MNSEQPCMITISKDRMSAEIIVAADETVGEFDIWQALKAAGICHGLQENAVLYALENRDTSVAVATGTPPLAGADDRLHWYIDEELLHDQVQKKVADDLRQEIEIPAVEPGQLLAQRISGKPGTPGMNVCGESIPAPSSREIVLRPLKGTNLSADGNTVMATTSGRPRFERSGKICRFQVLPVYTHNGDLTVTTGHLIFQGDVIVLGHLLEGTSVTASGSVEVSGNCIGASISAGQSIQIRGNVIQSRLVAGSDKTFAEEVRPLLEEIILTLYEMSSVLDSLDSRGQLGQLPFSEIANRVINLRYANYNDTVNTLGEKLRHKQQITPGDAGVIEAIKSFPHFNPDSWSSRTDLARAASSASQLKTVFTSLAESRADIQFAYALHADIQAANKIIIRGQGSLHSNLVAGEEAHIHGKLRSGSVTAKDFIYAREIGSDAGALTTLSVGSEGRIEFDRAFENTVLYVGSSMSKIVETTGRSKTRLDEDGRLTLVARH